MSKTTERFDARYNTPQFAGALRQILHANHDSGSRQTVEITGIQLSNGLQSFGQRQYHTFQLPGHPVEVEHVIDTQIYPRIPNFTHTSESIKLRPTGRFTPLPNSIVHVFFEAQPVHDGALNDAPKIAAVSPHVDTLSDRIIGGRYINAVIRAAAQPATIQDS